MSKDTRGTDRIMRSQDETLPSSTERAATIVAAYLSRNSIAREEIAGLISTVSDALRAAAAGPAKPAEPEPLVPAVPIRKSITDEFIVCLEDGKRFKSLKRHLMTRYGMTPEAYRQKWGLPSDYPMVAPSYAATRSALARSAGLGRKPATDTAPAAEPDLLPEPEESPEDEADIEAGADIKAEAAAPLAEPLEATKPEAPEAKPAPKRRAPRKAKVSA